MNRGLYPALVAILAIGAASSQVMAHHSAAMFDFSKNVWVNGVIKDIRVINPHMSLTLATPDAKGAAHDVMFEGHSVNNFYREGWRPAMLKVGDKIKVRFNPRKDGAEGGFVNGFVTADGKEIAFRALGQPLPPVPPDAAAAPAK
jgi:Family of unknown function (DUF6152)